MAISGRFEGYIFGDCEENPFPKVSKIIDGEFGARGQTSDREILSSITQFQSDRGKYVVVIARTIEAVTCIVLNAIIAFEDQMRDQETEFYFFPSHINDDIRHGVDAIVYRKNTKTHPPKFEPIAGIDLTVSGEQFTQKKRDIAQKGWTRGLYFNGNGGTITLPHIVLYHHLDPIRSIMEGAELSDGIKTYRDLQVFVNRSMRHLLDNGHGGNLNINLHMDHGGRSEETPNYIRAMDQLLGRGD
ncbi:hypothetical protein KBC86_03140 [Candidatus Gracilibacteria bacterium]|nr:hypothetical protein [Candidatus Gracilibacteria bacterium]